jgi:hypothetical protein
LPLLRLNLVLPYQTPKIVIKPYACAADKPPPPPPVTATVTAPPVFVAVTPAPVKFKLVNAVVSVEPSS